MKRMRVAALVIAAASLLGACGGPDASQIDIKEPKQKGKAIPSDYEVRVPEKLTVYQNINEHPTIAQVCIDNVAFATTSRDYTALIRVAEWDSVCEKVGK